MDSVDRMGAVGQAVLPERADAARWETLLNEATGAALIVVDVQNDFCPGGALGVSGGDEVVSVLNRWIRKFRDLGIPVAFTMDWHPSDHCSFAEQGGVWPSHCVQNESGSSLRADLETFEISPFACYSRATRGIWAVFKKGFARDYEAYSGFDGRLDGEEDGLTLDEWLKSHGVKRLYVGGLATDYCVKATVLDGLKYGYEVSVIRDGVRAVDVTPRDGEKALDEMTEAGAFLIS